MNTYIWYLIHNEVLDRIQIRLESTNACKRTCRAFSKFRHVRAQSDKEILSSLDLSNVSEYLLQSHTQCLFRLHKNLNPLVTIGFSHTYEMDESAFIFRGSGSDFAFLFHFSIKFMEANRIVPDGSHIWGYSVCKCPIRGSQAYMG